ncbi:MAG: PAAR domain-containing protein [Burkholderiaceae bacterium]|nr:PAAR domain-containing protein [Burkholderiaceae bacterium]
MSAKQPLGAARVGDEIAHGTGILGMLAGAAIGAAVGALAVAGTVATGGVAAVIIAGSVAAGALSLNQIVKGVKTIFELPDPTTGVLTKGSLNISINGRPAVRASVDGTVSCMGGAGIFWTHPPLPMFGMPGLLPVAEGSGSVSFNNQPAARINTHLYCGAKIRSASKDVSIGGPTLRTGDILDITSLVENGFNVIGALSLAGGGVLAVLTSVAAVGIFSGAVGITWAGWEGFGALGNMIGPGYGDLLQGIFGMSLLGLVPKAGSKAIDKVTPSKPDPSTENLGLLTLVELSEKSKFHKTPPESPRTPEYRTLSELAKYAEQLQKHIDSPDSQQPFPAPWEPKPPTKPSDPGNVSPPPPPPVKE